MKDRMNLRDQASCMISRGRGIMDDFVPKGKWVVEHVRAGQIIGKYEFNNLFNGGTPVTTWYAGLISSTSYSAIDATDTMGSHAGWTEFTSYSQSTRVEWTAGAASSQSITNGTAMTFSINGSGTVKGLFVTSVNTKSGTTGVLWNAALFSADVDVVNGDELRCTYTLSC
jgi:hypothetical protein